VVTVTSNWFVILPLLPPPPPINTKHLQTCDFTGNLHPESAPVHRTASGERRKQCDYCLPSYHSSHKTQSRGSTNMFIL